MAVIEVDGLRKSYGPVQAVRGVSFSVEEGEVFGLLGPNGAGKTTIVEILEGYRRRDAGTTRVLGDDPAKGRREVRQKVGLVLQTCAIEPYLSVRRLLDLYRSYYPTPLATADVLEMVGLSDRADTRVRKLSGGLQRRLDLALAMVGDPDLIFLDEPTTGFDPSARRHAWELVRTMRGLGKTILLTTHYMDEAQNLTDRVCVIRQGEVARIGTPDSLRADVRGTRIQFLRPTTGEPPVIGEPVEADEQGLVAFTTESPDRALRELTAWAAAQGVELERLEVRRPTLEDVYLELTGGE
ncbi:MAG: ABC transporter ATP-binding protein [Acidobacteria bacterium]|nr:ABC transporter ATP-binding protein [Acidobacteriota bacterium]